MSDETTARRDHDDRVSIHRLKTVLRYAEQEALGAGLELTANLVGAAALSLSDDEGSHGDDEALVQVGSYRMH